MSELVDALRNAINLLVCRVHGTTPGSSYSDCDCPECGAIRAGAHAIERAGA